MDMLKLSSTYLTRVRYWIVIRFRGNGMVIPRGSDVDVFMAR